MDNTFEVELALVVTQDGKSWYSNVSNYEGLPKAAVLEIEDRLYKVLGELLEFGKSFDVDTKDIEKKAGQ
jgi:hypothetical protein